jgi:hypothetical protein
MTSIQKRMQIIFAKNEETEKKKGFYKYLTCFHWKTKRLHEYLPAEIHAVFYMRKIMCYLFEFIQIE